MYCTVEDVEAYYNNVEFDYQAYVTNSEVISFIAVETAFINSILKKRYSLPLTDTDDLLIVKMICEKLVVGTIDDIIREKSPNEEDERGRNYRKEALGYLKDIKMGDMTLDAVGKTSVMMFNNIDSNGDTVKKQFKVSDIDGNPAYFDKEKQRYVY